MAHRTTALRSALTALLLLTQVPGQDPTTPLAAVPFPQVVVRDAFFAPRRATNTRVTLAHALDQLEQTGTLANFDRAAAGAKQGYQGFVFQDSDAYKALEAVAYALADQRDPALERRLDAVIHRVAAAQQPDGYLNTSYTVEARGARFHNLRDDHELYCAGHLFEAAVAHFRATGKRTLLDVACRYADLLVRTFGPGDGQHRGYCGHPEVELALVALWRVTHDDNYLDLAQHFVTSRGQGYFATEHQTPKDRYDGSYWLDHQPVLAMRRSQGHAVRAAYLMCGAVDIAAAKQDRALLDAVRTVYRNTVGKNQFVTGGIGPSAHNEGFTTDYDLPTESAYQESCASIALVMWAHRLLLVTRDPTYADAMERALYNAIPAGVQLDGTKFFYVNPLASRGGHHRKGWFGCACCPPNLARTFAAVGGYAYAHSDAALYVNLYVQGEVQVPLERGRIALAVDTDYPWQGEVVLRVLAAPAEPFALVLRVPGWSEGATVAVGAAPPTPAEPGYTSLRRVWQRGDTVHLRLPMPVQRLGADPRAEALRGRVAFQRGPIVYCAEQVDQAVPLDTLVAAPGAAFTPEHRKDWLGGVTVLRGTLPSLAVPSWRPGALYRPEATAQTAEVTLVPYAVWDNRSAGPMSVWLPTAAATPRLLGPEHGAEIEISYRNTNCFPEAIRDGLEPKRSGDTPRHNCHFWDHRGGTEWVQYTWPAPQRLAGCRIYWFDDTGHGACRLPKGARLLYRNGDSWQPVALEGAAAVPVAVDRWCEVRFAPVATTALRLEVEQQEGWSSGVLEWRLVDADD